MTTDNINNYQAAKKDDQEIKGTESLLTAPSWTSNA